MGLGSAELFRNHEVQFGVAPADQTSLGLNAQAGLPVGNARHIEQSEIAGAQLRGVQGIPLQENPELRQISQMASEATSMFLGGFARDTSKDVPQVEVEEQALQLQQQQLTASMSMRNFSLG